MRSQGIIMGSLIKDSASLCLPCGITTIQTVKNLLYPGFFGQTLAIVMMYKEHCNFFLLLTIHHG